MAPLSLRIVQDNGTVTRKIKLDPAITVREAHAIVREKSNIKDDADYGLFLKSNENEVSGIWMEEHRTLGYYMLRDGDRVDYLGKMRNLRIKMLDDSVKTLQVDQSKTVGDLMISICSRLRIANHEEYGLCLDEEVEAEESREKDAASAGTLTLKKKSQLKDRDLQFEQLSKKLKTDDNVEWIDAHKTLSEVGVAPDRTVLLKRRLFYSDRNVDSRDPVQLNLLYVQARDNILDGRHPVTEAQAVEFAGIQCQIHFGDFQEDKHKPGFIENMKEYLPEQYVNVWGVEKKIFKEYRKHQRLSALEAKHLYTKTARSLPTYGVTFFLVKEQQKDKKKLVPRLLGISSESILRLDEVTKEILQTWPLTHVKTYHAAKGEIFTLNFGDYSDKPYSVKTRDAYRIRDILEDYIDIIRRRMLAPHGPAQPDSAYITQDNVSSSQANIVQHISNNAMKVVEQTFVGPSKLVPFAAGSEAHQGTQIITVQQMVVSEKGNQHQQAVKGGVPMRADMSLPFTRRLNRLNSNSVKVVSLLTDPTEAHIEDSRKIIEAMNEDMPFVRDGVKETIEKQTNEDEKKKLQDQLNELDELIRSLTHNTSPGSVDASEAEDAAMKIADLTTQMYFALDVKNQRRSRIISRSRKSFIEDEKCQRTLRKASYIAATSSALSALEQAQAALSASYSGPGVDAARAAQLEAAAVDKLGKINAAIAHYTMAYSDPSDVDYEAAINSMHTIHELMPVLAKDTQALCSAKDPLTRKQILLDAKTLSDAIKKICSSIEDREKVQDACKEYAEASGRLVFAFEKGRNYQKENEMLDLADEVGVKASQLLISAQEVAAMAPSEPAAAEVDAAGVRTAEAAKDLISRVQLTAPTIHEPHCQSAVTAAAEALSSCVQRLAASWKPLLEEPDRHEKGENMHHQVMELAKALDRLKDAYSRLGSDDPDDVFDGQGTRQERQKLKFINTLSGNKKRWQELEDLLKQPSTGSTKEIDAEEAQRRLAQRLGHLNAAIASLLAATSDREHPDYATAELALSTINELMPQVIQDTKIASANKDPEAKAAMMEHIKTLCDASKGICAISEECSPEGRSEAISKYTNASGKLVFGISHTGNPKKENQILELADDACQKTTQLLSGVRQLSAAAGGDKGGEELDARRAACADAAQALLTTAQLTAPSISEPRCQSALLSSVDKLASSARDLAKAWEPLEDEPQHKQQVQGLQTALGELEGKLDVLRKACQAPAEDVQPLEQIPREQQRLQFIKTMSGAKDQIQRAQKALDKPIPPPQSSEKAEAVQHRLSGRLGELNAAIAALLSATADREKPDYKAAEEAVKTISDLLPHVVQDTQSSSANKDEASRAAMLDLLRELCEASRAVCWQADGTNPQDLSDAVSKFSDASGKLVYVVNPRSNANRENQIMALSAGACQKASQLLSGVEPLARAVGGSKGQELDTRGAAVADAAQGLLQTAQVTASSISESHCKRALLSSADQLSSSAQELAACWRPLSLELKHQQQTAALQAPLEQLEDQLDALRKACHIPDADVGAPAASAREQRAQFVDALSAAAAHIHNAQKAIDKPIPPPLSSETAAAVQHKLSGRLGELNAAIAALLSATADQDKPDYKAAEQAIKTISELMPQVVQDTQSTSANRDEASRAAMLDLLRELCEASRAVCSQADAGNPQGLNDAVSKFADASGKLVYVVSPRVNAVREKKIMGLSAEACNTTSQLLSGVQQLSTAVGGEKGQELDTRGAAVADAAQGLLQTAQVKAPSISEPHCKRALLSSADQLSSSAQELAVSWKPLSLELKHQQQLAALQAPLEQLEDQLDALRKACHILDADVQTSKEIQRNQEKLQFVKTVSGAQEQIQKAQKALDKPIPPSLPSDKTKAVQQRLSGRLAELNASIASLLAATNNREKPDYKRAVQAVKSISELMPHIVQDTQSSCADKDEATRAAVLGNLRGLCEATGVLCSQADGSNAQAFNDAVAKFSDASGKLVYVMSPRVNASREQQILELAAGVCNKTSQLLSGVQQVSTAVGGERGQELDTRGAAVADAAQGLLQTAQVTAPFISDPYCKAALLSSADLLPAFCQELRDAWELLAPGSLTQETSALHHSLSELEALLQALKKTCDIPDEGPQEVKKPPPPTPTRKSLPPPPRVPSADNSSRKKSTDATKEFLDRIRCEETQDHKAPIKSVSTAPAPSAVQTDDEKRMHQLFCQTVDDADRSIKKAQESLVQASQSLCSSPAVSAGECLTRQARLQRTIASAAVEVASLVGANYDDTIDYSLALTSAKALPQLMTSVVEDGTVLSSTVNEDARKAFLEDMLQVCQACRDVCDAANNDREKLNDAAIQFGDKSAKLLYVVSNDVDPALEKEIITRAKAIGDSVAQISSSVGGLASSGGGVASSVPALCTAGARCQHTAGKLIYTAKLVAPSIYETPCQEALYKSADNLSSELSAFQHSWKPFCSDPGHAATVRDLNREADNLQRILEGLKSDVKGGRIGQRREIEKLVVEDTPIRQLTMKIIEDAQKLAESTDLSAPLKKEYVEYSTRLNEALRALDLAHARCKRTPHDTNKRRDLETAVQNLQVLLLQSRPSRGDKEKSNIVDLREFIDEVSAEAAKLADVTSALEVPSAGDNNTLREIEACGRKISQAAYDLTHTDGSSGFDASFDDILDVDKFGQECDDVIKDIMRQLQSIQDAKARSLLYGKMLPLTESCHMLRFATKSGISAAKGAALDSSMEDLEDIESRLIKSIVRDNGDNSPVTLRVAPGPKAVDTGAAPALCRAVCAGRAEGAVPRAAVAAYIAGCAAATDTADPDKRNLLLRHLYKLVHLLRARTAAVSTRNATWQPLHDPEVASITEQILQEIQNPESKFYSESGKVKKIINDSDLTKLLVLGPEDIVGDKKQQEDKLTQLSTKLNSMCGTIALSSASPESLTRSAHAASEAALELAAVARGCKDHKDPVQCERIEESVQEMTFTTYSLLKTAELSCQEPNNMNAKRRLHDACRALNESINKLMSASSSASKLKQECGSLSRSLQWQLTALLRAPAPTSAMPYEACCAALDDQQQVVYKLKNDQPMSRHEFARSLNEVNEAVCKTTEISTQCAYLLLVSEKDSEIAKKGPVDVPQIQKCIEALQDSCMSIIGAPNIYQAKEETDDLHKRVQDFSRALDEAQMKVKDGGVKATLTRAKGGVTTSAADLWEALKEASDTDKVTSGAVNVLEEVNRAHALLERCPLAPPAPPAPAARPDTRARCDELNNNSKSLLTQTHALMQEVSAHDEDEMMTWVTFNTSKTKLLDAYDALVKSIRLNGQRAGFLEGSPEDEANELETRSQTYLEVQVDLANKWLQRAACKAAVKATGQQAVRNVIDIATKMSEDLKGSEREEIRNVITETEELLTQCSISYDIEKYSVLIDRIKELKKAVQRGVVTRVVEDFMEEPPIEDLDLIIDTEKDEQKRKFLLERKIAELLAQLGRVTRTARFVADAAGSQLTTDELLHCSEQTELLAPMLVQAAQERISSPDNQAVVDNYKALLAKYAESISKVRDLCDRAVDPMEFVQTAGETMQRLREESTTQDDVQKGQRASEAIIKLANRSIEVSMSCPATRRDPELLAALQAARRRVLAATPATDCRASRLPDWRHTTAQILRTTGEVESALGGENIFKKQPVAHGANQQIYSVAHDLHKCVSEWSSRDNEIVAVARRMAVLMARLSQYMETDKKHALIATSKAIVAESHEVAELAKKLAHECTDVRIKTNLLQTCERIPTIGAQLKMLTTVKGSSLGHQGNEEDKEAMDMLVGNAQSLMMSIQEVVKAAAGASVKIMSQRGPKLRWVRKNYY